jgi:hypothetical protein
MARAKQTRHYQELTFLIAAVLMLVVLVVSVSWVLGFLIKNLNSALNPKALEAPPVTQFNIEEFKNLGLIQSSQ